MRRLIISFGLLAQAAAAQTVLDIHRYPQFLKLFEPKGKPLACDVRPMQPHLDFGFHFVSGYLGRMPLKQYEGAGHRFGVVLRVTPDDADRQPVYFTQLFGMRKIPPRSKAEIEIDGAYLLGPGGYTVEWVLVDRDGATCRKSWHVEAKLPHRDRDLQVSLKPGVVQPRGFEARDRIANRKPDSSKPLRLTVYLHMAPLSYRRLQLHPYDQILLLSSLQSLLDRTPFTDVKVVAFNLDQQKEIFRDEHFDGSGWEKLAESVSELNLVTVPLEVLQRRRGHLDLLAGFLKDELEGEDSREVVVFLGPTARQDDKLRLEEITEGHPRARFFYLQYKPYWTRGAEFPDVISRTIRRLEEKTFFIYSPHDFSEALREIADVVGPAGPGSN